MIFNRRKSEDVVLVNIGNGRWVSVPMEVSEYIDSLRRENDDLRYKINCLEGELVAVKPVVANPTFKQAVSKNCTYCKYVLRSRWNGDILGCMKDNVCEDFVKKEEGND